MAFVRWNRALGLLLASGLVACSSTEVGSDSLDQTDSERAAWVRAEVLAQASELTPDVRARKFEKMSESPFTFYRGSNHLFWADFAGDERLGAFGASSATAIWLQGDLHVNNYGAFHDDEGAIVYDLNDFDESLVADYQFDLWRAAASLVLVARSMSYSKDDAHTFVDAFTESYLDGLDAFRGNDDEKSFAVTKDNAYGRLDEFLQKVEAKQSRREMLDDWTTTVDGTQTLDPTLDDLAASSDAIVQAIHDGWSAYGASLSGGLAFDADYFAIKGIADRLDAGIGSLGTPRYYVLIEGPSGSADDDVILDVKRTGEPTAARYLDAGRAFDKQAQRAVTAQKALGVNVDDHLGVIMLADGTYSVRERSPYKETFEAEEELTSATRFTKLCEQWGLILAADHARADEDFDPAFVAVSFEDEVHDRTDGSHDAFRELAWSVAWSYGKQVEKDYESFLELVR